ncbi:MAG: phytanoyl-CoA dioxygenase family protein [Crocosphaera sp.]|nr:phytanoyl-CoA dioxygenase family protein [Crocosphaera sp.]
MLNKVNQTIVSQKITQKICDDGFVLIENILSIHELKRIRQLIKNHFRHHGVVANSGLTQPNAAVEVPEINWLFYHPKILAVMGQLLGQEQIMFTSHCDVHCRTLSAWHKDDGMKVMEGGYFGFPAYDQEDCKVYKVALYLQDHDRNKAGLTVRKGSHKLSDINQGEEVYLKTKGGDAIIFDVRLTHTGQQDIYPVEFLEKPNAVIKKGLNKVLKISSQTTEQYLKKIYDGLFGDRLSIFFTYGLPNEYTKNFAINNMKRQLEQNKNSNLFMSEETKQKFLENNVVLAEEYFKQLKQ